MRRPAATCTSPRPQRRGSINQVERWFAALTRKQLRGGIHTSTMQS
jgi:hypothetical protein